MKNYLRRITLFLTALIISVSLLSIPASTATAEKMIGINVLLKTAITPAILSQLGRYGKVRDTVYPIKVVTLQAPISALSSIRALSYVRSANPDSTRNGSPVDTVSVSDFANGHSTWDLDSIDVTNPPNQRTVAQDGSGVYVAVIDTGLLDSWRQYFPQERIATQYGIAFGGGGGEVGAVSQQPNKWEHDQNSHGTHVTSTILGYSLFGIPFNGVAPLATVIPVKVLNQNGSGWSSVVARGIVYVADLKAGPLSGSPVVINMSLGGPTLDAAEQAAIDYAISKGVILCASAGNSGELGMGYPGAYAPVISAAASGWKRQWRPGPDGIVGNWWYADDVADPTKPSDFYIVDFSSREKPGQDLDVSAPGTWVVGPYQLNSGHTSYFYLSGTSMASPHVAGIVALMAQKKPSLTASEAETILESTAIALPPGSRTVRLPDGSTKTYSWDSDATGAGLANAAAALSATN